MSQERSQRFQDIKIIEVINSIFKSDPNNMLVKTCSAKAAIIMNTREIDLQKLHDEEEAFITIYGVCIED
jgi:hypothetical protein